MQTLILVRHGETAWNARGTLQGLADVPLSDEGRAQALRLRRIVKAWEPDAAFSSDLVRATETAACLGFAAATADPGWREADLGLWTGQDAAALRAADAAHYDDWRAGRRAPPEGESFEAMCERVEQAVRGLVDRGPRHALVVTHGGVVRAALARLVGITPERIVPVSPASVTVFSMQPRPRLLAFNVGHHTVAADGSD
jgi:probable phosphoglycerate mutase